MRNIFFILSLVIHYNICMLPTSCLHQKPTAGTIDYYKQTGDSGEVVYQLVDLKGKVVYYGITIAVCNRLAQHTSTKFGQFDYMEVIADGLTNSQARAMEGALIRKKMDETLSGRDRQLPVQAQLEKAGLLNVNRGQDMNNWITANPLNEFKNRIFTKPKRVKC